MNLTAEYVMDGLMELRRTVSRLHDADIIDVDIKDYIGMPRVFLYLRGDPTEVIRDIGNGLIDVDDTWDEKWDRCSITDTNGVEVFWLTPKTKAPDAATSGAIAEENTVDGNHSIASGNDEVKEENRK